MCTKATGYEPLGCGTIRQLHPRINLPLVAIVGMTGDNVGEVTQAGAAGVAVIVAIAVFPLAMPLIAGSGAITSIVLLTENALHNIPQQAGTAITLCVVLAINYAVLKSAGPIHRLLGSTGTAVVARVTGLVLTALAVQVMIVGFQNVFPASL